MARTFVDNAKPFCFSLSESNLFGESNHLRDIIELPNWSESKVTFARGRKGEIIKISSYLKWLDWMAFYISRGKETTKRTTENFEKSIELVIESYTTHEEARLKKNLLEQFKDYPSAAGLINKLSLHKLKNLDYNPDFGMIAYLDGRSEWGSSGGTALYSQVRLWVRGNEYSKEFQYRDRYSGTNDNYAYEFRSVKILKVEKEKENLHVLIEAIPGQEKFHSTKVEFNVELSTKAESLPEATPDQQREFLSFFEKIKAEKMAGLTKFNGQYFRKPVFNGDTSSGYSPYPQPTISCSELKPNLLTGAFVIKETIDHRVDDLQKRYTLYLVVGETCLEVYEDHAYEIGEGDASIFGLKISEDKIFFSTRGGRKERPLR
jgi:hypothetical protein